MSARRRVSAIGAAIDSLILILEIAVIMTIVVMALVIWRGVLSGNLRKGTFWRKPLLLPALVFSITLIVAMIYVPHPMSAYNGTNQINNHAPYSGTFRVYDPGAYETEVQVRIDAGLFSNERLEVHVEFSQDDVIVGSLFLNLTEDDFDMDGGVTSSIIVSPGRYDLIINGTHYIDDDSQVVEFLDFYVNQAPTSIFINELVVWSTIRFVIGFGCFFLVLGGVCIDRGDARKERRWGDKKDGELYKKSRLGWKFV